MKYGMTKILNFKLCPKLKATVADLKVSGFLIIHCRTDDLEIYHFTVKIHSSILRVVKYTLQVPSNKGYDYCHLPFQNVFCYTLLSHHPLLMPCFFLYLMSYLYSLKM
jgi:hypothetical protein